MLSRALFSLLWGRSVRPVVAAAVILFVFLGTSAVAAAVLRRS